MSHPPPHPSSTVQSASSFPNPNTTPPTTQPNPPHLSATLLHRLSTHSLPTLLQKNSLFKNPNLLTTLTPTFPNFDLWGSNLLPSLPETMGFEEIAAVEEKNRSERERGARVEFVGEKNRENREGEVKRKVDEEIPQRREVKKQNVQPKEPAPYNPYLDQSTDKVSKKEANRSRYRQRRL